MATKQKRRVRTLRDRLSHLSYAQACKLLGPEAKQLIMEDIGIGETWAQTEIERYTYRMPGQATAYYYGYSKMQELRALTELKLQDDFDQQAFHDFVLAQGLLPPDILREAVMKEFVPSQRDRG